LWGRCGVVVGSLWGRCGVVVGSLWDVGCGVVNDEMHSFC
jgi:hypothetical protein